MGSCGVHYGGEAVRQMASSFFWGPDSSLSPSRGVSTARAQSFVGENAREIVARRRDDASVRTTGDGENAETDGSRIDRYRSWTSRRRERRRARGGFIVIDSPVNHQNLGVARVRSTERGFFSSRVRRLARYRGRRVDLAGGCGRS